MELDFSRLNALGQATIENVEEAQKQPQNKIKGVEPCKDTIKHKNTPQAKIESIGAISILQREANQNKEQIERACEAYYHYQENIKKSNSLQIEILKGLTAGENIYSLFLKAIKAISLMADNALFYNQAEESIKVIYGEGLAEASPIQLEIEQAEKRLTKLRKSAEKATIEASRQGIIKAIKKHETRIKELKNVINA